MKTFTFAASLAIALTLITSESCSFRHGNHYPYKENMYVK